ncbi:MAG: biotin transporter BioY [Ignavibacteriota bacterium]|jgi:biotin transport system substrate-specific component|nr:MAG: biotin transporter BioY [Chlorobiota bacterium]MBE7477885.1 biotin transporter BioY [Ignavibacteriales bacterium]MBL1124417.1 biotin transporter BioY [Ignavibacteriota bacterium]MBV6421821.1 Biotin transporter BioY [Ignavibacteriaceae bacterium]MCE7857330.1 biotin transporter BioY [Ignavibacteria bacterium CHB3]MEB2296026.1 biotin transporter BioY [Ignavibacteria bacterium]
MKSSSQNFTISHIFSSIKESELFWILSFTILTIISAQVSIPVKPVPFTLQTMIVLLAGAFLGAKNGAYSQIIYIFLGAIGLPVFAQTADGTIGFARLIGPTGGYLLAFPIAAYLVGYMTGKNQKYLTIIIAMFIAELIVILFGTLYLSAAYLHNIVNSVKAGASIFTIWMVVKVFVAASIYFTFAEKHQRLP